MTKRDWIAVGLKFLGVYFAVLGVVGLAILISTIASDVVANFMERDQDYRSLRSGNSMLGIVSLIQPLAYLGSAYVLTRRTDWCLRMAAVAQSEG